MGGRGGEETEEEPDVRKKTYRERSAHQSERCLRCKLCLRDEGICSLYGKGCSLGKGNAMFEKKSCACCGVGDMESKRNQTPLRSDNPVTDHRELQKETRP